jgi:hypothetical protein
MRNKGSITNRMGKFSKDRSKAALRLSAYDETI